MFYVALHVLGVQTAGMSASNQLRPNRLPVVAQVLPRHLPCGGVLDLYASLDGNGANTLDPLVDSDGGDVEPLSQGRLASQDVASDLYGRIGENRGGSFLSHRLTIRECLTRRKASSAVLPSQPTSGESKAMLTGKELGSAIREAVDKKGVRLVDVATHFGVKPPSVQDWIHKGTISKARLPELWLYFSDVVGPEHWGLASFPQARVRGQVFEEITEADRRFLKNFRLLPDDEQAKYEHEIAQRAAVLEAYLTKQLPRFTKERNQTESVLAVSDSLGSNAAAPSSRPAEQFGIDELGADSRDVNESSSEHHSDTHGKNRRRA